MADNSDQILHFHEYFKIIRNRLWVIFTIFALTVMSGYYVTNYVLPKIYTATAEIQIHPRGVMVAPGIFNNKIDEGFDSTQFQAEFEIMQSPDVLLPIIKDNGLDKIWAKRVFKSNMETLPDQDALGYMTGILKLDFTRGTNIIKIEVSDEVPEECAQIANALADRYKAMRDSEAGDRSKQGIDTLRDQITQQEKVVDEKRALVEKMRSDLGDKGIEVADPTGGNATNQLETDLESRKRDLLQSQEDYDARKVLLQSVINLPDDQFISTLDGLGRQQQDIAALRADVEKENTDIINLLKDGFEENHPRIVSMRAEVAAKQQQITDLIAGLRNAMKVDTDMAKSRVDLLQKQVDDLTEKVRRETTSALVPFREAQRQLEQQQSLLDVLTVRLKENEADYPLQESPVTIISRAQPPEYPSLPKKPLDMAVSVVAGLFVGIGVAFLIEYLDTSVKTMADAETLLGLPVLTVIPNKGGPMPLIQDTGRLPHAEGYRILRAKLDLKVQNGIGPSLSMLSGGPGEGKSTTIYNLAVVCAQAGQSVILIDCDLRRPTLHDLLGVSNERGLSNYLRGEGEAVAFVQRTLIPKLMTSSSAMTWS